jgi:hypothetical protein
MSLLDAMAIAVPEEATASEAAAIREIKEMLIGYFKGDPVAIKKLDKLRMRFKWSAA